MWKVCWNKGRLCWKIANLFYFCHLKKLVRPETFGLRVLKNAAHIFHDSLGHPVGSTQKQLPRTLLPIVRLSDPYHCILSTNSQKYEINISQSYTSLKAITETNYLCYYHAALDGVGFTERQGGDSRHCALTNLFLCHSILQAFVKRQ